MLEICKIYSKMLKLVRSKVAKLLGNPMENQLDSPLLSLIMYNNIIYILNKFLLSKLMF